MQFLYETNDAMQHATKYYTFLTWEKTQIQSQATHTLGGNHRIATAGAEDAFNQMLQISTVH